MEVSMRTGSDVAEDTKGRVPKSGTVEHANLLKALADFNVLALRDLTAVQAHDLRWQRRTM